MKLVPVFITVIAGFIATGKALSCNTCKAFAPDCIGESCECNNGEDTCAKVIEYNTVYDDLIITVKKGCLNGNMTCGNYYGLDTYGFYLDIYTECCTGDNCNCGLIEVPWKNMTENGYQCDSCFAQDSLNCTQKPMKCTGNKTSCLSYNGKASRPGKAIRDYAFSGCATPELCEVAMRYLIGSVAYNPNGLSCKDALKI
ncbi:phospholipase A2 inhibitor and Ly6/PLAUR domain-containing protein-like [Pseudophryne corroboree]|uniref:phospholipase A2 inhibitor and Ly6/PLAUR domain-containing protein-like n=1 Tax=Pseudophryne corroboree TaxID=495146 RepID=UPI0030816AE2